MLRIALYQPDIAQNVGAAIRLCACMGIALDVIEPCGFPWDIKKIRQSGMDYVEQAQLTRYDSWDAFLDFHQNRRLVLMTTKASDNYLDFEFTENDIMIAGRESSGVPDDVHKRVDGRVKIDMKGEARSLNIINATSMITGEAIRQIGLKL
jgi:tRNA (cytidine/uridine-2'-O-)-methyltransferase